LLLLLLVATVFVTTLATLLENVLNGKVALGVLIGIIFVYLILSTILSIDKIIGKLYRYFGAILLIGTISVGGALLLSDYAILSLSLSNWHPDNFAIFPILSFTITLVVS